MHPPPYFDRGADRVRFMVPIGSSLIEASIGRATLHYRYHPKGVTDDALSTYVENAEEINAAVRRRMAAGAREPVMLRDPDVQPAEAPPMPVSGRSDA